jgi:hypothetical protein
MAFTTLMLFQLFNVFNARADERSAFAGLFTNRWLWVSVSASLLLHAAVIYTPFLQQAFSTTQLDVRDWLGCAAVASSVLWVGELAKAVIRWVMARDAKALLPPKVTPSAPRPCETTPLLLTVNAGSSSIKCALFTGDAASGQLWTGAVTGIGTPSARMAVAGSDGIRHTTIDVDGGTHRDALMRQIGHCR